MTTAQNTVTNTSKAPQPKPDMPTSQAFATLLLVFFWPLGVLLTLLFCRRWLKKPEFWICLLIWAPLTTLTFNGIRGIINNIAEQRRIEQEIIATERSRDYFININDKNLAIDDKGNAYIEVDCHLKPVTSNNDDTQLKDDATPAEIYNHTVHDLACNDVSLEGNFSAYETTSLHAYMNGSDHVDTDIADQSFTVSIKRSAFSRSDWEHDDLNRPSNLTSTLHLYVSNSRLNSETMKSYQIAIKYRFSDADFELLKKNQIAYQEYKTAEAERIAKEEKERKEKEEQEKKAEEERLAREEAEKKAREEAAKQPAVSVTQPSAAQQPAATTQQPASSNQPAASKPSTNQQPTTTTQPTASKPATSTPSTTQQPTTSTNLPLKAICNDGTISYQDNPSLPNYRGMCSGHGGIKTKLGRVP